MAETRHLRIKRHYSIVGHGPNIVELRFGVWNPVSFTITDESESGRLFGLMQRLDGALAPREIAAEQGVPREDVETLVDHLIELGVVEEGATSALDHYIDVAIPTRAAASLNGGGMRRVVIAGDPEITNQVEGILRGSLQPGSVSTVDTEDPAWRALSDNDADWLTSGLEFEERLELFESWSGALVVLAATSIHPLRLKAMNRVALALRIPWIHAAVDGPFAIIGPTVVPGRSACQECFEIRVMMNARESAGYQRYKNALAADGVVEAAQPVLSAVGALVAAHTALEAVNFAATGSAFTVGKALTIHLPTMEIVYHDVLSAPTCPACSPLSDRDDEELYLDIRATLA